MGIGAEAGYHIKHIAMLVMQQFDIVGGIAQSRKKAYGCAFIECANQFVDVVSTDAMRDMMGRIDVPADAIANEPELPGDVDHEEMTPEPSSSAVPALINKAIAASGPSAINPEWHQIKNLPGYMQRPIRAMGRATMGAFTDTPIEEISLVANLGGQGPNSDREVSGVAQWLKTNAQKVDSAEMDFGDTIPGYNAQTLVYKVPGMKFLVVRDFAGGYIYAWPDASSDQLSGSQDQIKSLPGR